MSMSQWSTTAANNASGVTSVNWAEGQAPSTVNDSARQVMADVANWYGQNVSNLGLASVSGTNTITATGPAAMAAYALNQVFIFIPAATNTGATTLNITPSGASALGAKNVFANGAACSGGEIVINVPVAVFYDGTQFNIINPSLYNGTTASTFTFDGSGGTTGSLTMIWQKDGKFVSLYIPVAQATSGTSSTALNANTALPTGIRPTTAQKFVLTTSYNNGGNSGSPGAITVNTNGIVAFERDGTSTAYTNSTTCGIGAAVSVVYQTT